MNETLSVNYESTNLHATEELNVDAQSSAAEFDGSHFDQPLHDLVAANADALVTPDWLGGAVICLGDAMRTYAWPPEVTPENLGLIIAAVTELLANRVTQNDEAETEEDPPNDELAKKEDAEQEAKTQAKIEEESPALEVDKEQSQSREEMGDDKQVDSSAKAETGEPIQTDKPAILEANQPKLANAKAGGAEAELASKLARAASLQPTESTAKTESAATPSFSSANAKIEAKTSPEPEVAKAKPAITPKRDAVIKKTESVPNRISFLADRRVAELKPDPNSKIELKTALPTFELPKVLPKAKLVAEVQPIIDGPEPADGPKIDITAAQLFAESGHLEPLTEVLGELKISSELGEEETAITTEEAWEQAFDYQTDSLEQLQLPEDEVAYYNFPELALGAMQVREPDDIYTFELAPVGVEANSEEVFSGINIESNFANPSESVFLIEKPDQISLGVEEVEEFLEDLAERIVAGEPEIVEKLNISLDKIAELSAKLEPPSVENTITETEVQTELEEILTELLDQLNLACTPGMVELLVHLTQKYYLVAENQKQKNEEQADQAPQGIGTHEFIKKLLVGINTIKKANEQASAIGCTALKLTFNAPILEQAA